MVRHYTRAWTWTRGGAVDAVLRLSPGGHTADVMKGPRPIFFLLPLIAFFAIKWLPRTPAQAVQVLAIQAGAALAAITAVFFLT